MLSALLPLLLACQPKDRDGLVEDGWFADVQIENSTIVPTVATVSWTTSEPVGSFVRYGVEGGLDVLETPATASGDEHRALLVGVPENSAGWFQLVAMDGDEEVSSEVYDWTTGQLDPAIPRPTVTMGDSDAASPGLILAPMARGSSRWVTIMDQHGQLVWGLGGADLDTMRARMTLDGQGIIFMDRDQMGTQFDLVRVDFTGKEIWRQNIGDAHHDFELIDDENFLVLGFDTREVELADGPAQLVGDTIETVSRDGRREVIWNAFDYIPVDPYLPMMTSTDHPGARVWTHGNYLHYDRETDRLYTTMRDVDMAFALDLSERRVLWSMGGTAGTIASTSGQLLLNRPHSIWPTGGGYLTFNQGVNENMDCSFASMIAVNADETQAQMDWAYPGPTCYQVRYIGNAQPLAADRVLVSFGIVGLLDEISADTGETLVRHSLELGNEFLYVEHIGKVKPTSD